ncbi:MAG: 23S rRNA (pseudouridine(1915)-N(3))-methyltransferase RlmH [Ruminococcus sp.]|nr:23S rRNA (pseudouridine(1915)-N(3))-methyltransferase RlmH [Ruminococcus sp.]
MNVKIICIGNLKENYHKEAIAEYSKRLTRYCNFGIIELPESKIPEKFSQKDINTALEKEASLIEKHLDKKALNIALCIEGKQLSSESFAENFTKTDINLIIGSSHGLSEKIKSQCERISFSKMTFPHQLMRVIAAEQVYRAFTIINNGKYHK